MMSAPRNPVEIRQDVRRALTTVEAAALAHIEQQVAAGRQVTRADLCVAIGSQNYGGGTGPDILKRLESKGYITRNIYQRGVQVCLTETGLCSLPPKDTSPHWRLRADRVASPTPRAMRNRQPSLMQWAESFARTIDMPLTELLERACVAGLDMIRAEQSGA